MSGVIYLAGDGSPNCCMYCKLQMIEVLWHLDKCQQMCRQSGREKMELRSVIYEWAIWWSIHTCDSPAAYSAACYPDVRRFTARLTARLTHVSPDTCLTLACGSPLTI